MSKIREVMKNELNMLLNEELLFYADPEWQHAVWSQAYGEKFGERLIRYLAVWETVDDEREHLSISRTQFDLLVEFKKKLIHFQTVNDHPENPMEYRKLLSNPEWKGIQRFAKTVYDRIAPSV